MNKGACKVFWQGFSRDAVVWIVALMLLLAPSGLAFAADEQPAGPAPVAEDTAEQVQPRQRNWRVRFMGAFANDENGIIATSVTDSGTSVSIAGGVGAGVNFEYRNSPLDGF